MALFNYGYVKQEQEIVVAAKELVSSIVYLLYQTCLISVLDNYQSLLPSSYYLIYLPLFVLLRPTDHFR